MDKPKFIQHGLTFKHGLTAGNHEFRIPEEFPMRSYTPVGFEKMIENEAIKKNYGCVISPLDLMYAKPNFQTFKWTGNKDFTK